MPAAAPRAAARHGRCRCPARHPAPPPQFVQIRCCHAAATRHTCHKERFSRCYGAPRCRKERHFRFSHVDCHATCRLPAAASARCCCAMLASRRYAMRLLSPIMFWRASSAPCHAWARDSCFCDCSLPLTRVDGCRYASARAPWNVWCERDMVAHWACVYRCHFSSGISLFSSHFHSIFLLRHVCCLSHTVLKACSESAVGRHIFGLRPFSRLQPPRQMSFIARRHTLPFSRFSVLQAPLWFRHAMASVFRCLVQSALSEQYEAPGAFFHSSAFFFLHSPVSFSPFSSVFRFAICHFFDVWYATFSPLPSPGRCTPFSPDTSFISPSLHWWSRIIEIYARGLPLI